MPRSERFHRPSLLPSVFQDVGQDVGLGTSTGELDARRLRLLYLDLLGRPPLLIEREQWAGRAGSDLLDELIGARSFWENWLEEQLYYFLLVDNFRPTAESVLSIPADLEEHSLGVRESLHRIALCSSFDRRNPGPDTFVTVVMEQLLGIDVQKEANLLRIGKRMYDGGSGTFLGRKGNNQADIVRIAIEDDQAIFHFLAREHRRLLRDDPDPKNLASWAQRLIEQNDDYPPIVRDWFESSSYGRRLERRDPMPNRVYVRSLFVDLVDRLPDEAETQRIRNALDGLADAGPLRSVIARLLLDSGAASLPPRTEIDDPATWIASLFQRFLGRAASESELSVFAESFDDPACRPETIVYAIVSHPDYSTW